MPPFRLVVPRVLNRSIAVTHHRLRALFASSALSPKILLGPSQKDFLTITTFLFQKVDPNFAWPKDKKPEEEFIAFFKTIGYPFNISKSGLSSVGTLTTWPVVLAALTWLIELLSIGDDPAVMKNEMDGDVNRDRLYFDKLAQAYGIFMQGGDDMPFLEQELAASIGTHAALNLPQC